LAYTAVDERVCLDSGLTKWQWMRLQVDEMALHHLIAIYHSSLPLFSLTVCPLLFSENGLKISIIVRHINMGQKQNESAELKT
jgi:hypothetical protein